MAGLIAGARKGPLLDPLVPPKPLEPPLPNARGVAPVVGGAAVQPATSGGVALPASQMPPRQSSTGAAQGPVGVTTAAATGSPAPTAPGTYKAFAAPTTQRATSGEGWEYLDQSVRNSAIGDGFSGVRDGFLWVGGQRIMPQTGSAAEDSATLYQFGYRPPGSSGGGSDFTSPFTAPAHGVQPSGTPTGTQPTGAPGAQPDGTPPAGTQPDVSGPVGTPAWNPAAGLIDQVKGITPDTAIAAAYDPTAVPDTQQATATGYDAQGYTADQVRENLSQATNRIIGEDSPLMARARAGAAATANARGLLNSSMAVQAGETAVLDQAIALAAGDVDVSKFNVGENNAAMRFSADAKNTAAAFLVDAKNKASQFNTGESNKAALFAVEQANLAARFAAEAEQAASEFNATAFNQAKQRYADAVNAAAAAQFEAENLARRDTATFSQQANLEKMRNQTQLQTAQISASSDAARIASAEREGAANRAARKGEFDTNTQLEIDKMGQNAVTEYSRGSAAIDAMDLEPEARANAHANYDAIWAGNPYLPLNIEPPKPESEPEPEPEKT